MLHFFSRSYSKTGDTNAKPTSERNQPLCDKDWSEENTFYNYAQSKAETFCCRGDEKSRTSTE